MSMSDVAEAALLDLLFINTSWAGVGDGTGVRGSSTAGSFYISLHTADPGEAGNQLTSEATYGNYARVAVARTSGGWTRTVSTIKNTALVQFLQCNGSTNTITHFAIGTDSSGAGQIVLSGQLSSPLSVSNGIQPQFAATALTATVD